GIAFALAAARSPCKTAISVMEGGATEATEIRPPLICRHEANNLSRFADELECDIEQAIGTSLDIADASVVFKDLLGMRHPVTVDRESQKFLSRQGADEKLVFPLRKFISRIKFDFAHRDRGRPVDDGRLHPGRFGDFGDGRAIVIYAMRDQR